MHIPNELLGPISIVVANNLQALVVRTLGVIKAHKAHRLRNAVSAATAAAAEIVAAAPTVIAVTSQPLPATAAPIAPTTDQGESERLIAAALYQKRLRDEFGIDAQGHIRS